MAATASRCRSPMTATAPGGSRRRAQCCWSRRHGRDPRTDDQGPQIVLRWDRDSDPLALRSREWLVTNGLGGYASGTSRAFPRASITDCSCRIWRRPRAATS